MLYLSAIGLVAILTVLAVVGPQTADGGEETFWNAAEPRVSDNLVRMTAAEDALRVLRSVPLTSLSTTQRRHVKRRILAVLGLDHAPRPLSGLTRRGRRASVAAYMMALYMGGGDHDDQDVSWSRNWVPQDWTDSGLLTSDWHQLSSAELVISFANQGIIIYIFI